MPARDPTLSAFGENRPVYGCFLELPERDLRDFTSVQISWYLFNSHRVRSIRSEPDSRSMWLENATTIYEL